MHPFFTSSRPGVFAHRGGAALAPENTLAAFERGLTLGADGIELDVHLSREGAVVVHHDATVDRTTSGRGAVSSLTADELARLDAGYHFQAGGEGYPFRGCGIGVPRLADVLSRFRDARVIIEMKQSTGALAEATLAVVRRADAVERVCIGSKWRRGLSALRASEPSIATSAAYEEVRWALYRSWIGWPPSRRAPYAGFQVPESAEGFRVVSPRFIRAVHRSGRAVQVWTVNREDDARRLLGWGVDALITDRPDVIVPLAREGREER
jgi:glycerophosphoryl diester phosphodiesterase